MILFICWREITALSHSKYCVGFNRPFPFYILSGLNPPYPILNLVMVLHSGGQSVELVGGGSDINGATSSSFKNFLFSATSFAKPIPFKKETICLPTIISSHSHSKLIPWPLKQWSDFKVSKLNTGVKNYLKEYQVPRFNHCLEQPQQHSVWKN